MNFPIDGTIYDYYPDYINKRFKSWNQLFPNSETVFKLSNDKIFINTLENSKYQYIIN